MVCVCSGVGVTLFGTSWKPVVIYIYIPWATGGPGCVWGCNRSSSHLTDKDTIFRVRLPCKDSQREQWPLETGSVATWWVKKTKTAREQNDVWHTYDIGWFERKMKDKLCKQTQMCRKTPPNSTTTVTLFSNQPQVHSMDRTGTRCTNIYIFDQYLPSTSEQQVWTMYDTHFPHLSSHSVA